MRPTDNYRPALVWALRASPLAWMAWRLILKASRKAAVLLGMEQVLASQKAAALAEVVYSAASRKAVSPVVVGRLPVPLAPPAPAIERSGSARQGLSPGPFGAPVPAAAADSD